MMFGRFIPLAFIFSVVHSSLNKPTSIDTSEGLHTMTFIGTVEGKSFFVDNDFREAWANVSQYCETANMKIASFHSSAQLKIVADAIGREVLNNSYYWTSGQETNKLRRFSWSNGVETVQPEVVSLYSKPPITYCLELFTSSAYHGFRANDCQSRSRTLCEIS